MTEREYLLSCSLEPVQEGDEFEGPLPLHTTVMQWFTVEHPAAFRSALMNLATEQKPFNITGGNEGWYGPNGDVRVRILGRAGLLFGIHHRVLHSIEHDNGQVMNPAWAGDGYSPHISYLEERGFDAGEEVELRTLELFSRRHGEKLKRAELVLPLGKADEVST